MKLHILSDIHLGFCGFEPPRNDADVVILAGDVARPRDAVAWARQFDKPVLYVLGNHEFYGSSLEGAASEFERQSAGTCVRLLDNAEIVIGGCGSWARPCGPTSSCSAMARKERQR